MLKKKENDTLFTVFKNIKRMSADKHVYTVQSSGAKVNNNKRRISIVYRELKERLIEFACFHLFFIGKLMLQQGSFLNILDCVYVQPLGCVVRHVQVPVTVLL